MKAARRKLRHLRFGITLLLVILGAAKTKAQPWYIPTQVIQSIELENKSSKKQNVWLAEPIGSDGSYFDESIVELEAHSKVKLQLPGNSAWVQIKSYENVPIVLRETSTGLKIPAGRFNRWAYKSSFNGKLIISNLSPIDQEGLILVSSSRGDRRLQLNAWQSLEVPISLGRGENMRLEFPFPVAAVLQNDSGFTNLEPVQNSANLSGKFNFQMQSLDGQQSFVLSTNNEETAREAREQIQRRSEKILIGKIEKSSSAKNYDLSNRYLPSWSWELDDDTAVFVNPGFFSCGNFPQLIEDFLMIKLIQQETVCFPGYKAVKEL